MALLEFWVHGFRNVIPSLQLQFLIFFHLKMGKFWSLLSKLMGSGTHYSRIDGFPGTHANGAIGTWHYFVLRIWRCLKCEEKIMQRVPNRIHSIKVHTAWLPLYYEQFGTFCIIFDICPLHKQHIVRNKKNQKDSKEGKYKSKAFKCYSWMAKKANFPPLIHPNSKN